MELTLASDALTITIGKRPNGDVDYALKIGDRAAIPDDANLDTLAQLLVRLDVRLAEVSATGTAPPEVRFACHRDLPSERVHELVQELETRKKANRISSYRAEVNEKK